MFFHNNQEFESRLSRDILKGIWLDSPNILLSWDTNDADFHELFKDFEVHTVVIGGYCVDNVIFFGEERCHMGIGVDRRIHDIDFSRDIYNNIKDNDFSDLFQRFFAFQEKLKSEFGMPIKVYNSRKHGYLGCDWSFKGKVKLSHYLLDRFGWGEHVCFEHV